MAASDVRGAGGRMRAAGSTGPVCSIQGLSVIFPTRRSGTIKAVDDLWLDVMPGETIGLVGESGSGKSITGLALLGLVPAPGSCSGRVLVDGTDMLTAGGNELRRIRGRSVGLVLQDPTPSLNPIRTVASQLRESARCAGIPGSAMPLRLRSGLEEVGLDPTVVLPKYPFELSGGMNQRVAIAMALLQDPKLLVADEPTTALDVTTQAQILALLDDLRRRRGMSILLISHDIGVVYQVATRIAVMYAGRLVEVGETDRVIADPAHPYTRALIASVPTVDRPDAPIRGIPGQLRPVHVGEQGCPFAERCAGRLAACSTDFPARHDVGADHFAWCWLLDQTETASAEA